MLTSPVALLVGAAVIAVTVAVVNRKRISTLLWGDEEGEYQRELLQYAKTHAAQLTRQSKACEFMPARILYPHLPIVFVSEAWRLQYGAVACWTSVGELCSFSRPVAALEVFR